MALSIAEQAEQFALDIMETLAGVLPAGNLGVNLVEDGDNPGVYILTTSEERGIELQVSGSTRMRFEIDMKLSVDSSGKWLKVIKSSYVVVPEGDGTPYFHYDYLVDASQVPAAHINVHAHRDDLIAALVLGGRSGAAKNRRRDFVNRGRLPRVGSFHFPVGGPRFRPGLEDVLEVAVDEFGLDHRETYRTALQKGRERFRLRQLAAAVRDSPSTAAEVLRGLGYAVVEPTLAHEPKRDWLERL